MKLKCLNILIVWSLMVCLVYAQNNQLTIVYGFVEDSIAHSKLKNATIKLFNKNKLLRTITTLEDGSFSINKLPVGKYEIIFSFVGYNTAKRIFEIKTNSSAVNIGKPIISLFFLAYMLNLQELVIFPVHERNILPFPFHLII